MNETTEWEERQKNISQVIEELKTFEDQELVVVVTADGGETFKTVKLISKGFKDLMAVKCMRPTHLIVREIVLP